MAAGVATLSYQRHSCGVTSCMGHPWGTCRCFLSYYRVGQQIFHPALPLGRSTTAVHPGLKLQLVAWTDSVAQPLPLALSAERLRLLFACCRTKYSQLGQEHRCSPAVLVTQPGSRRGRARSKLEFTQNLEGGYLCW